ncbi:type II/IV secretion system protein [Candidatus Parcubacteria bacterium]|nr:type II/IV secretion system protein [Candidatus Parcubacteria bacterium]
MAIIRDEKGDKQFDELRKLEEEKLVQTLAERYAIPYVDLTTVSIETDALKLIPEARAKALGMAGFKLLGRDLYIGLLSPKKEGVDVLIEELKSKWHPYLYLVSHAGLNHAWSRYKDVSLASETKSGVLDISEEALTEMTEKIKHIKDIAALVEAALGGGKSHKISKMLEIILGGAFGTDASDVHIEPEEAKVRLRFRLDGVLEDVVFFDFETYRLLNSRVKLLSQLKLNVKTSAQDGRFSIKMGGADVEIRVSFVPGAYGESIVMRVLNPKAIGVTFENLGIAPKLRGILEGELEKPNGIILTTGPTGSGKTTTLYAFLKKVYTPGVKIITIEDPVEYHLEGITQTQTDERKGYTFLEGLRAALRQDPDIMMVGEVRDAETAKIAINSALTGHLVFSTLHTNNAAGAIPRLIDLEVNPKIISSALNISLAQRLVRKLCTFCKKEATPSPEEKILIDATVKRLKDEGNEAALADIPKGAKIHAAVGCEKCNNTGYKGRIGIFEAILMDETIENATVGNPSEREIKKAALPQHIPDLAEDAVIKVLSGTTSFDEVRRVVEF